MKPQTTAAVQASDHQERFDRALAAHWAKVLTLTSPLPASGYPSAWAWLREFPSANFDDYGPATFSDFCGAMIERSKAERTWGVLHCGVPCGIIAYLPITPRSGTFHGICFSREVHGTGVARAAVSRVIQEIFESGIEKISATFFADNLRVARFLASLGAVDEGLLRKHTVRDGIAIDMRQVAFFNH